MMNKDLMDFIFDDEIQPTDESDGSLFDLLDDNVDNQAMDFAYEATSESVNPDDTLFTEVHNLKIIED